MVVRRVVRMVTSSVLRISLSPRSTFYLKNPALGASFPIAVIMRMISISAMLIAIITLSAESPVEEWSRD